MYIRGGFGQCVERMSGDDQLQPSYRLFITTTASFDVDSYVSRIWAVFSQIRLNTRYRDAARPPYSRLCRLQRDANVQLSIGSWARLPCCADTLDSGHHVVLLC